MFFIFDFMYAPQISAKISLQTFHFSKKVDILIIFLKANLHVKTIISLTEKTFGSPVQTIYCQCHFSQPSIQPNSHLKL